MRVDDAAVVIEPEPTPVRIERRGVFAVAHPMRSVPVLGASIVETTRKQIEAERENAGRRTEH